MRLRYLHLAHYPPLSDLTVRFASGSPLQEVLERECAIHFVVGLNGSGKSHLLRAVAEVFLALADERLPGYPVTLIYELGRRGTASERTVVLDCPGAKSEASLWLAEGFHWPDDVPMEEFDSAIERLRSSSNKPHARFRALIAPGQWFQRADAALPRAVLAYTTGAVFPWQALWQPPQDSEGLDLVILSEDYDASRERPPAWTSALEAATQAIQPAPAPSRPVDSGTPADLFRRPILLDAVQLKCALLAVTLHECARVRRGEMQNNRLTGLLMRGGWHTLVSVHFQLRLHATRDAPRQFRQALHDLLIGAGDVIREPHPLEARRSVYYDLEGPVRDDAVFLSTSPIVGSRSQGKALWDMLGEVGYSTFERFGRLLDWYKAGVFDDLELFLRRAPKSDDASGADDVGVLRYGELSDGEQMVLARMGLFHLLEGQDDALLLLDEPETHFNDSWKREIVDIIDDAVGKQANDVLIATHSAIVLSDVFNDEIVKIEKTGRQARARTVAEQTFATDPSTLIMTVFGADDSIGLRAQQFIEGFIAQSTGKAEPSADDIRRLEALISRMGSGFYRSELRTLLHQWKKGPELREVEAVISQAPFERSANEYRGPEAMAPDSEGGEDA